MSKYKIPKRNAKKIQEKLRDDKVVLDYDEEELQYLGTPIGLATYDHNLDENLKHGTVVSGTSLREVSGDSDSKDNIVSYDTDDFTEDSYEDVYTDATDSEFSYTDEAVDENSVNSDEAQFLLDGNEVDIPRKPAPPELRGAKPKPAKPVKKKAHWSDRIKCQICGGEYTRSAVSAHRGTKKHQIYANANKKFLNIMQGK